MSLPAHTYVIAKRGKFLKWRSYATGLGYSHRWTRDITEAQRFASDESVVDSIANMTGGKIVAVESTRKELRDMCKRGQP